MTIQWPASPDVVEQCKKRKKDSHTNDWANQPFQGKGVKTFKNNPLANSWIRADTLMPGEVKMRSKVFPVKSSLSRTNPDEPDVMCRRCHVKPETMGHVIGECVVGKLARVRRHDKIVQLVAGKRIEASTRTQVFDTEEGSLRPDLVVIASQCALDIEVTVRC